MVVVILIVYVTIVHIPVIMKLYSAFQNSVPMFFKVLLLLLLYDMDVSCHGPFLPGISLEPAVIPTAQASSFTLQYFPYYV